MSPIRPENKARYPSNWRQIREQILERAGHCCEGCGIKNHAFRAGSKGDNVMVVLTIAHIDQTPENNDPVNLLALCQRCHNKLDAPHRAKNRKRNKMRDAEASGQGVLL